MCRANRRVGPVFCVPIHGVQKCPQKFIVASAGFVICDLKLFLQELFEVLGYYFTFVVAGKF